MANHPPNGHTPNVQQISYDFPNDPLGYEKFNPDLVKYIPNLFAKKPTLLGTMDISFVMKGCVLISARHLYDGDEVLMDYRLNEARPLPKWYSPYLSDSKTERW